MPLTRTFTELTACGFAVALSPLDIALVLLLLLGSTPLLKSSLFSGAWFVTNSVAIALLVTVQDGGNPVLTESETLFVYVNGSFDSATASKQRDAANNNVAIVVICVLVFVITCIILVLLTLFYLRRKAIGQHCHQRHTKYDGTNVDSAQAPACMDTSSNSIRTDVSDVSTAKASFRGGHTISYVPADDPGSASYASPYVEVSILMLKRSFYI